MGTTVSVCSYVAGVTRRTANLPVIARTSMKLHGALLSSGHIDEAMTLESDALMRSGVIAGVIGASSP